MIIGIVLIALILTSASVYIGSGIYWNDITQHYNMVARHTAQAVENVFTGEELKEWGDLAYRYAYGKATDEEVAAVTESERYRELKHLTENLNISNETNDIYIVVYDVEVSDNYTQEADDAGEWNPLIYIMDTYYIPEDQYPLGTASAIDEKYVGSIRNCWVNGVDPTETIITYWHKGGLYILTGMHAVVNDGKTVALIGVEMPLPTLEKDFNNFIFNIILVDAIAMVIILIIAIILIYVTVTRPIKRLAAEAQKFVGDNSEVSDRLGKVRTRDEIQVLDESILDLERGIIEYISNLTAMTAEKERVSAELGVATKIQAEMLPKDFPNNDRIELFAAMTPAKEVGGDFYDFFFIDDDHLAMVMADVSGKGVPAALFCVVAKAVIRDKAMLGGDPAAMLFDVNNTLCENNGAGMFITVWLGILDLKTGIVKYVNAGHEYPIIGIHGKSVEVIERDNCPPLAAMENTEFTVETLQLEKGDNLFLYTDGVPEAKAKDGSRFGMDRLVKVLERNEGKSPEITVTDLKHEVDAFQPENDPFDDVTIMSVVWRGGK
jgi:sigma-B regulation protein RsbU (phosphoserine phosphatase)